VGGKVQASSGPRNRLCWLHQDLYVGGEIRIDPNGSAYRGGNRFTGLNFLPGEDRRFVMNKSWLRRQISTFKGSKLRKNHDDQIWGTLGVQKTSSKNHIEGGPQFSRFPTLTGEKLLAPRY